MLPPPPPSPQRICSESLIPPGLVPSWISFGLEGTDDECKAILGNACPPVGTAQGTNPLRFKKCFKFLVTLTHNHTVLGSM